MGAPGARLRGLVDPTRLGVARMALLRCPALALLFLVLTAVLRCQEEAQPTDWRATLKTIRNGVHMIDTYLNAALDLLGGEDGLCQYKCSDGERELRTARPALPGAAGGRRAWSVRCEADLDAVLWPWEHLTNARILPVLSLSHLVTSRISYC